MDETQLRAAMQQTLDNLVTDVAAIRTGRATPGLVDSLTVSVYGGQQRLQIREIGSITVPDANMIVIDPWDKSIIGDIRKGIMEANVGLNPSIDGEVLRIVLPPMTTEDRERYVKLLSQKLENSRITIRQQRADAMQGVKRSFENKEITEDDKAHQEKQVQQITDEFMAKIEQVGENKKAELLKV